MEKTKNIGWREVSSFEAESYTPWFTVFVNALKTEARRQFKRGQRVRVVLLVASAVSSLGCSSSSENADHLFGTGGVDGSSGGAAGNAAGGGAAGAAGAAGSTPAGGTAGAGAGDAGAVCTRIQVVSTTYAANCGSAVELNQVDDECDGETACTYSVDFKTDPGFDPASGCPKDLTVNYRCVDDAGTTVENKAAYTPAEAYSITLECACG